MLSVINQVSFSFAGSLSEMLIAQKRENGEDNLEPARGYESEV